MEPNKYKYLSMLPVKTLVAWDIKNRQFRGVLVDGDYDGEYFDEYRWVILPSGYVIRRDYNRLNFVDTKTGVRTGIYAPNNLIYLHHLVLPRKPGLIVTHIDGDKLNNRSCNLAYDTYSNRARRREYELRQRLGFEDFDELKSQRHREYYVRLRKEQ